MAGFSTENYLSGSRFAAMANASVMIPDIWSVSHNQAGLGYLTNLQFSFHYENKFMVPQYGLNAIAVAIPTNPGTLGFSLSYFGYSKYHEIKTSLAYGKLFGDKFSAGIQLNYHNIFISDEYGRSSAISVEGGIMFRPIRDLYIGVHVFNPSRAKFNTIGGNEYLPTIFRFGLGYHIMQKIWVALESQKETNLPAIWKLGLEVETLEHLFLRAGISSASLQGSFGIGYQIGGIRADLAFSFHPQMGFTPHVSFIYGF